MIDLANLRGWWWRRQGLDGSLKGATAAEILAKTGWARSVAGANPYLTLFARGGLSRGEVDAQVAAVNIHELPTARGCTYVLPAADYALGLKVGERFGDAAATKTAVKFLGVTDEEIERLCENVLLALGGGPLDPKDLKTAVGDAVRHLGEEGKKRGQTTTLSLATGRLQSLGQIRRVPVSGRLDEQRYRYALWPDSPLASFDLDLDTAFTELARRYFRWTGPASPAHFQWFSGLGVGAAKAAMQPLALRPIEPGSSLLLLEEDWDEWEATTAPTSPSVALVSALDAVLLLRRDPEPLIDAVDRARPIVGEKGPREVGGVADLSNNAILDRGRLIGLWEYDPVAQEIAWYTFSPTTPEVAQAVSETAGYIREQLGDARSFSLDSPQSRASTIAAIRKLAAQD